MCVGMPSYIILPVQEVRTVKVADRTGMVNLSLWNEPGKVLQSGEFFC
jgi:hypothetical protein